MNGEKGQSLPLALIALSIGALVVAPFLGLMSNTLNSSQTYEQAIEERYAADAGVEYAVWRLKNEVPVVPQFTLNNKTVEVTIADQGDGLYRVTSTATSGDGSSTTIEACLLVGVDWLSDGHIVEDMAGDVYVDGDALLDNNVQVDGSVYATGSVTLDNNAEVTGDVVADGNITLNNNGVIGGNVSAGGDLILGNNSEIGSLEVIGNVCASGDITLYNNAIVNGNVYTSGSLEVAGNAIIRGNVYMSGDISRIAVENNARVEGDISISGSITGRLELGVNGVVTGAVWATGDISSVIRGENVEGGVYYPDERGYFDGWECPQMPAGAAGIAVQSWEISSGQV